MPLAFSPKVMNGLLNLLGGPALPTQYLAIVLPPQSMFSWMTQSPGTSIGGVSINPATALRFISGVPLAMMIEKASIPGFQFLTKEIYRHGKHMKLPYARSHDTVKFTFICTNSMLERTFFDFWTTYIQAPNSHYMEYFSNFKSTIIIKKLMDSGLVGTALADPTAIGTGGKAALNSPIAEIGNAVSVYELQEAYPVRIGSQELSYSETHSFLTLDVEFEYTHMRTFVDRVVPDHGPNHDIRFGRVQKNVEGTPSRPAVGTTTQTAQTSPEQVAGAPNSTPAPSGALPDPSTPIETPPIFENPAPGGPLPSLPEGTPGPVVPPAQGGVPS